MTRQMPDAVCDELRREIRKFLASRTDIAMVDLIHYTKLSEHTGRAFMNGNCPGGRHVVSELHRALSLARAGDILPPGGTETIIVAAQHQTRLRRTERRHCFYETQMVQRVGDVLDYCATNAAIGIVTADFGAGKTEAIAAWRRGRGRNVESVVFEFDVFSSSSKMDFAHSMARNFGTPVPFGSQFVGPVFRDVCDHLRLHPTLLIFDQCETVRTGIFQMIRQCYDQTRDAGVGIVILAAPLLLSRLARSGLDDLGALQSRVGIWAALDGVTRTEMAAILKQESITSITDGAFSLWWNATGGSMRRLMAAIDLLKSKHAGKPVTEKTIEGVASHLWGVNLCRTEVA